MSPIVCTGTRMQDCATWRIGGTRNVKYPRLPNTQVNTKILHELSSGSWAHRSMQGSNRSIVCWLAWHVHKLGSRPALGGVKVGMFRSLLPAASHGLSSHFNR